MTRPPLLALLAVTLLACAPRTVAPRRAVPGPQARVQTVTLAPIQFVARRSGPGYTTEAFSAEELFAQGLKAHRADRCAEAIPAYRKLLQYFGATDYAAAGHYNLALCLQAFQKWGEAAAHFEQASTAFTTPADQRGALGAAGVNYADAGDWQRSRACFERLLARKDLTTAQRIETLTRSGYASYLGKQFSRASERLGAAIDLYTQASATERLTPFYAAMAEYYRGAIYHDKARTTRIRERPQEMEQDVETLATWVTRAHVRYWAVVKLKEHYWSMAAVYQVGTLYLQFRQAILAAPQPAFHDLRYFDAELGRFNVIPAADQRAEYRRKVLARTRVLLRHAVTVYQKGLATAERIGARNEWVAEMRKALAETKARWAAEPAEDRTPLSSEPGVRERSPLVPGSVDPNRYQPAAIEL